MVGFVDKYFVQQLKDSDGKNLRTARTDQAGMCLKVCALQHLHFHSSGPHRRRVFVSLVRTAWRFL